MPATQHRLPLKIFSGPAACLLAALLAGCATSPSTGTGPASVSRAERLLQQNNPTAAAQMYERLAQDNPPPDRNEYALAAARAWLAANRADDAQRVAETAATALTPAQQFELELLRGEIAMARGQYLPAWQQVSRIPVPVRAPEATRLLLLQQQVALRAGQPLEAVRAGIERDTIATTESERTRARRDLLSDLRSAIDRGLRIDPASSRDAKVRGWLELGQIAAAAGGSPMSASSAIERWRSRFPGHPAATIAAAEILTPGERASPRGAEALTDTSIIGLLLPLTGSTATAAALTRDGFLAAIARLPQGSRPAVRVYDTGTLAVGTAIQNARADGAGFLVGPLTRAEVQAAMEQRSGDVPMLLLNNLAGNGFVGANLYQYALAPEDEARQIARQMWGAGQRNAMVLAPAGEWGTRVAAAFSEELTRAGGQVVAQGIYDPNRDLIERVTAVLGIDESRDRHRRLQQITSNELVFDPRPRPDIDAIFAAGFQSQALRQINSLLRNFISADGIPVFMTQDALSDDSQTNRDLDGMYVLDMPWILESSGPTADLRAATGSAWSARGLRQSRYFAFGYDAANLALAIHKSSTDWPLPGLTGRLNLTPEGRVERSLNWARVREGVVLPADPVSNPTN